VYVHLKTLTLRGFKSFAAATTLRFEPGINCVVGPNGSGKSNVVDALAWVMGEQGAKNLRGGNMADVIFAGTSKRPALGRAEVSLTIDNSDGVLPIDYTEVTISRTLFRSGGSEYAINGASCRLLDIQELLSDTGMGREMHVIIGQGKLDEVLKAGAEDRRGFIEEAAGVLKHRRRKEKALRKLESMSGSLARIEDLSAELRRQLGPLARQAEAARKARINLISLPSNSLPELFKQPENTPKACAYIGQSTSIADCVARYAQERDITFSRFLTLNTQNYPVSTGQIIDHIAAEASSTALLVHISTLNDNLRELISALHATARRKPVVVLITLHDANPQAETLLLQALERQHILVGCVPQFAHQEPSFGRHALSLVDR